MLRIIYVFACLFFVANAKTIEVDYRVEFGIFGEVAKIHSELTTDKNHYIIEAKVAAAGIAKTVTSNLKERHISKGHILKHLLITDMYQMIKSYSVYNTTTIYRPDHSKKSLSKQYIQWKSGKKKIDETTDMGYYGYEDLMGFFLNLSHHIQKKYKHKTYRFKVIGADRKKGRVDVEIPNRDMLQKIQALTGKAKKGEWYSIVTMYRKLYHSKKGELNVLMGKDGLVKKAVLKDLIFFGDVRIIREN